VTNKLLILLLLQFTFSPIWGYATGINRNFSHRPLYVGALGGYGSTTWNGLVPTTQNQSEALNISTPISVKEGGGIWGILTGYEFNHLFAIEAAYMHYPKATVTFDMLSIFSFDHNNTTELSSQTEMINLMAKLMLEIPNSGLRLFSSAGVADIHRKDILLNEWHVSPSFGVGVNYRINEHFMGELGGNYAAGFGTSQLNPADNYIPFLYSITLRLAYFI